MTERTFSMSTGLAASTVTPGSTPPESSLTTPVMAACANASVGNSTRANSNEICLTNLCISSSSPGGNRVLLTRHKIYPTVRYNPFVYFGVFSYISKNLEAGGGGAQKEGDLKRAVQKTGEKQA